MLIDFEPVVLEEAANPLAYEDDQEDENLTVELEKSVYETAKKLPKILQDIERPVRPIV